MRRDRRQTGLFGSGFSFVPLAVLLLVSCSRAAAAEPRYQLFVINADGSNLHRIAQQDGWDCGSPQWSHDGTRIAYDSKPVQKSFSDAHVFVARADGSEPIDLGPGAMPDWSPDDKQIACHVYGSNSGVVVMNADGKGRELVAAGGGSPRWSPDGQQIAYVQWGENINVLDTFDGSSRGILEAGWQPYIGLSWSPDGKRICFPVSRQNVEGWRLAVASALGTGNSPKVLLDSEVVDTHLSWSPDGKRIAFAMTSGDHQVSQIYTIAVEGDADGDSENGNATEGGGEAVRLPGQDPDRWNFSVDWSPDGRQILFISRAK